MSVVCTIRRDGAEIPAVRAGYQAWQPVRLQSFDPATGFPDRRKAGAAIRRAGDKGGGRAADHFESEVTIAEPPLRIWRYLLREIILGDG